MHKFILAPVLAGTRSCTYQKYTKLSYISVALYTHTNIYIYIYMQKFNGRDLGRA